MKILLCLFCGDLSITNLHVFFVFSEITDCCNSFYNTPKYLFTQYKIYRIQITVLICLVIEIASNSMIEKNLKYPIMTVLKRNMSLVYFLRVNGLNFTMTTDEAVQLCVDVATWNDSFDKLKETVTDIVKNNTH